MRAGTPEAPQAMQATETTAWTPLRLRDLLVPNRVWLSPMCQYSADGDGVPTLWHLAHYGARAAGGAGMVVVECTGVAPDMRTTVGDLGLWSEEQVQGHRQLVATIRAAGSIPAVQLGVAGRKSSHGIPWDNTGTRHSLPAHDGGWETLAPSPLGFAGLAVPREMTGSDGARILEDIALAARHAHEAGYEAVEVHGANGYLFHQFLSPLSNHRQDRWGGDLAGRARFPLEMIRAIRSVWPQDKPLLVRLPASDLLAGGLTIEESVTVATWLAEQGVDMVDIGSGALVPEAPRHPEPLYNARFGPRLRAGGVLTAASAAISEAEHLDEAVPDLVDAVLVGRAMLRDPYWPLRARGGDPTSTWPRQYRRAF